MSQINQSLIISFYNGVEKLRMIINALERQTETNFEVIIADDGSNQESVQALNSIIAGSNLSINHLWHKDDGFRKVIILNEAIRKSQSDYLVFIDGDCIPHKNFMKGHLESREKGSFLAGRRVNLSQKLTSKLGAKIIEAGYLDGLFRLELLINGVFGNTTHFEKGFYIRNTRIRKFINRKSTGLLGCNFSLFKQDLIDINGFDERYLAPAIGEDSDIEYRLLLNGVKSKTVKNIAIVYHLFHKKLTRESDNRKIFDEVISKKQIVTPYGLVKKG